MLTVAVRPLRAELFPGIPFLHDLPVHNAREIDSNKRDRFAGRAHLDVCRHPRGHFLAFYELIVDLKRVLVVDEEAVKVLNALTKALEIPITGGGVTELVRSNDIIQC